MAETNPAAPGPKKITGADLMQAEQKAQINAEESERQRVKVDKRWSGDTSGSIEPLVSKPTHRSRKAAAEKVGLSEASHHPSPVSWPRGRVK